MTQTTPPFSIDTTNPQELQEMITELEQYRERLVNDTLLMAQKAKVMKQQALASLEPNLNEIDGILNSLRCHGSNS